MAVDGFRVTVEEPTGARLTLRLHREECQEGAARRVGGRAPRARVAALAAVLHEDWPRAGRPEQRVGLDVSSPWGMTGGRTAGMRTYRITVEGEPFTVTVEELPAAGADRPRPPVRRRASAPHADPDNAADHRAAEMRAPMPGKILAVHAVAGEPVARGAVLVVLEAMKMENDLLAPADGRVKSVHVQGGAAVNTGDLLVVLE